MTSWDEIKKEVTVTDGFLFAMFTDQIVIEKYPFLNEAKMETLFRREMHKLLDVRIFDLKEEYRYFRGSIGDPFVFRRKNDEEAPEDSFIEREQLFDIDTRRSERAFNDFGEVRAIGGGRYHLPLEHLSRARIILREYLAYDEAGHARVYDWRLVDFREE